MVVQYLSGVIIIDYPAFMCVTEGGDHSFFSCLLVATAAHGGTHYKHGVCSILKEWMLQYANNILIKFYFKNSF